MIFSKHTKGLLTSTINSDTPTAMIHIPPQMEMMMICSIQGLLTSTINSDTPTAMIHISPYHTRDDDNMFQIIIITSRASCDAKIPNLQIFLSNQII